MRPILKRRDKSYNKNGIGIQKKLKGHFNEGFTLDGNYIEKTMVSRGLFDGPYRLIKLMSGMAGKAQQTNLCYYNFT